MQLLINIVPNDPISWDRLFQLGENIAAQKFASATTNLQLSAQQNLTAEHRSKLAALKITVQSKPQLPADEDGYVINLRENDVILPGALAQWQSVTTQHAHTPVSLATFDNLLPLDVQMTDYLAAHANNSLLTTYRELSQAEDVWPQLWGLQSYSVRSNLKNFRFFSQRLRPTGVLLPVDQLDPDYPLASIAQNLQLLSQQEAILRLHVPTIQNGQMNRDAPFTWFNQLQAATKVPLDFDWQPAFARYCRSQLRKLLNNTEENQLTEEQQTVISDQLEQLTALVEDQ